MVTYQIKFISRNETILLLLKLAPFIIKLDLVSNVFKLHSLESLQYILVWSGEENKKIYLTQFLAKWRRQKTSSIGFIELQGEPQCGCLIYGLNYPVGLL